LDLFDSHCHLNLFQDQDDLKLVIHRSLDAGVTKIVVPGVDVATSTMAVEISERFPSVFAAVGIHPNDAANTSEQDIKKIEDLASLPKVVAIGEIGLDYHYPNFDKEKQAVVLTSMLEISIRHEKPIILHSRDAMDDLVGMIQTFGTTQRLPGEKQKSFFGVFHAFEGNASHVQLLSKLQFLIGIGGPITFKNNTKLQTLLKQIGLENVVLETDAPYLSPHPFRGQRNEPFRIPVIAQKVAELLNLQVELVAEKTNWNANQLFMME
jgi:TatD DNase family protein